MGKGQGYCVLVLTELTGRAGMKIFTYSWESLCTANIQKYI